MRIVLSALAIAATGLALFAIAGAIDSPAPGRSGLVLQRLFQDDAEHPAYAAVGIDVPATGESFLYVRAEGRWRCHTAFLAPTVDGVVPRLVDSLLAAEGVVRDRAADTHASYGLDPPRYRVSLRGPKALSAEDGDLLTAIEVGATLADGVANPVTFARRVGDDRVLELAYDPRPDLERAPGNSMPPMLDERLVPGAWPGKGGAFRHVRIEGSHGVISLVRRDLDPATVQPGAADWEWLIQSAEHETQPCSLTRVETFCAFLMVVGYIGLDDPARASELVGDPRITVLAMPLDGEPVELFVGDDAPRVRGSFCLNRGDRLLAVAADAVVRALDPDPQLFFDAGGPDPWSPFLGLE